MYYYILFALVTLFYLMKSSLASRPNRGLRLPPGPWKLPIIGSLHHLHGDLPHRTMRDLSRRHGPLMFFKFCEIPVVVCSREAAKEVFRTQDAVLSSRPQTPTVKLLMRNGPDIALAVHDDRWRQLRRICVHELLGANRVKSFRHIRDQEAVQLVKAVSTAAASDASVNLTELIVAYVNNVTAHAIMGDHIADRQAMVQLATEAVRLAGSFRLADLFPSSLLARVLSSRSMRRVEHHLDDVFNFMDGIISQHQDRRRSSAAQQHQEEDLIDVLLRIQEEDNLPFPVTMGTIKGTDSPASVLVWAMAELIRNPRMMTRAQSEVRAAFMGKAKVTEEGLEKLSYLHFVIKETLRLHNPGPFLLPRESQKTCQVMGYDVPKGTMVLVNAWAISRDPNYWDDPEIFKPERFENDTRDYKGRDYEFTPFGAGRRSCPGMLFATANMELALAHLLFYFDWNLSEGVPVTEMDMTETTGLTAKSKADLWVKPTLHVPASWVPAG